MQDLITKIKYFFFKKKGIVKVSRDPLHFPKKIELSIIIIWYKSKIYLHIFWKLLTLFEYYYLYTKTSVIVIFISFKKLRGYLLSQD
jgi:hypothetical protein